MLLKCVINIATFYLLFSGDVDFFNLKRKPLFFLDWDLFNFRKKKIKNA